MYRIRNVSQAICTAVYNAVVCCTINAIPIAKRFTLSSTKLNCLIFHIIFSFFYSTPFFCALPSLLAYFFLPPIPLCSSISDIFSSILHSLFLSFAFAQEFSSTICARSPSLIVLYVLRASRALTIVSNHLSPCLCVCCTTRHRRLAAETAAQQKKISLSLSFRLFVLQLYLTNKVFFLSFRVSSQLSWKYRDEQIETSFTAYIHFLYFELRSAFSVYTRYLLFSRLVGGIYEELKNYKFCSEWGISRLSTVRTLTWTRKGKKK